MITVPKCMSTQHPDNVNTPFFSDNPVLGGEDEVKETYYAYSHLGCDEQMWDCEGKEVDNFVIKKLITKNENYFKDRQLGKDIFLTLRVPNPNIEKTEAKILLETLESIPRSFDTANLFYNNDIPPIFEVILPMTTTSDSLNRIYHYYKDFVIGKESRLVTSNDISISDWIGNFMPKTINVIPLFEDMPHMLNAHSITEKYLKNKNIQYQRIFLARSDTAMNYGLITSVLLNKIALSNIYELSNSIGIPMYPILGVGSAPFRGNLKPHTVDRITQEYPSVHTFTIQSAFKYDNNPIDASNAVRKLYEKVTGKPHQIDEKKCLEIIEKYTKEYQLQIERLAPIINESAKFVPSKRKRNMHIGLFGYSRNVSGIKLPRAITFTSALYSIGIPPEILALNSLNRDDLAYIKSVYLNFENDIKDSLMYYNKNNNFVSDDLKSFIEDNFEYPVDSQHNEISKYCYDSIVSNNKVNLNELYLSSANIRKFLG